MVVVPMLSFLLGGWMIGWASAPFDRNWAIRYPKRTAAMSLAGPLSNLLLLLFCGILIRIGTAAHVFAAPARAGFTTVTVSNAPGIWLFAATMLSILFSLNLLLFVFNLLPLPPLDGSGLLMFFCTSESAAKFFETLRNPGFSYFGLMISWRLIGPIFPPVQSFVLKLLYSGLHNH
jgi:Zn-dependent protease